MQRDWGVRAFDAPGSRLVAIAAGVRRMIRAVLRCDVALAHRAERPATRGE